MPTPRRPGDPHPRGREFFGPATPVRGPWPAALTLLLALTTRTAAAAPATPGPATATASPQTPTSPKPATTSATPGPKPATANPTTPGLAPATRSPTTPSSTKTATTSPTTPGPTNTATASPTQGPTDTASTSPTTPGPAGPNTAPATREPALATPTPGDAGPVAGATATPTTPAAPTARVPARKPPRVDGPYIGGTIAAGGSFARVNNFPTPDPLSGGTMSLRFGEAIYPWMTIGLQVTGTWANRFADPRQRLLQGAAIVDFGFLPVPRIPLSLHVGFGAGGGAVRQADRTARSGFGGAVFTGAVRYEIFPLAARKRPTRGGGFSIGPELGWIGFTPAAKGRPMSNTIYIGLFMGFYFGS